MQPSELILELSHNCNLSCIMCGFVKERNQPGYFMTETTLDQILNAFEVPPKTVRLNGRGESTIHPHFPPFLKKIRARWPDAALHLFTNLNIKDTSRVELLIAHQVQLFISIDSPDPEELALIRKGARWSYIEANLTMLRSQQPRPYFVFTVQPENMHQIFAIAELAEKFHVGLIYNVVRSDVRDFRLLNRVVTELPSIRESFAKAVVLLKLNGLPCLVPDQIQGVSLDLAATTKSNGSRSICPALLREACVQYDGAVTPCTMFHPKRLGHIRDGNISEVLASPVAQEFRVTHRQDPYCKNCAWLGGDE